MAATDAPTAAGEQADVHALRDADQQIVAWEKRHHSLAAFRREWEAYQALTPTLSPWLVTLLSADPKARMLRLAPAPGRPCAEPGEPWVHRAAGRFRAALDTVPYTDDDPLPLDVALGRRFAHWMKGARALEVLTAAREQELTRRFAEMAPAADALGPRVHCHRDFGPWNWFVRPPDEQAPDGRLTVLDLGQARPDTWLADVVKLHAGPWRKNPALREAFFAGYGRGLSQTEEEALAACTLLHGLATLTWGARHGDSARVEEGWGILNQR